MPYYTTDSDGVTEINPTREQYARLLRETLTDPAAIADVWMGDIESGWTVHAYPSGLVQAENPGRPNLALEQGPLAYEPLLQLWDTLASADITSLLDQPWRTCKIP